MEPDNNLIPEHLWVLWTYGRLPFLLGWIPACLSVVIGSGSQGVVTRGFCLGFGILLMWGGYFMGVEIGYRTWQGLPNPPDEAFSDTDGASGLFLGWLPSMVFLGCLHALSVSIRRGTTSSHATTELKPHKRT